MMTSSCLKLNNLLHMYMYITYFLKYSYILFLPYTTAISIFCSLSGLPGDLHLNRMFFHVPRPLIDWAPWDDSLP